MYTMADLLRKKRDELADIAKSLKASFKDDTTRSELMAIIIKAQKSAEKEKKEDVKMPLPDKKDEKPKTEEKKTTPAAPAPKAAPVKPEATAVPKKKKFSWL